MEAASLWHSVRSAISFKGSGRFKANQFEASGLLLCHFVAQCAEEKGRNLAKLMEVDLSEQLLVCVFLVPPTWSKEHCMTSHSSHVLISGSHVQSPGSGLSPWSLSSAAPRESTN